VVHDFRAQEPYKTAPKCDQLRAHGGLPLTHNAAGVPTVAGKLHGPACIFAVLAAIFCIFTNCANARRMRAFFGFFMHNHSLINLDFYNGWRIQ
jgi:hypothetical protein